MATREPLGLRARLFLLTSLLVLLVAGSAILATWLLGRNVTSRAIDSALSQSQSVQSRFLQARMEQLELISRVFASEPAIVSFLQEAIDRGSTASILDLLGDYQRDLGFDFAVVLDPEGRAIARSDAPEAPVEDLSGLALVDRAFDEGRASGFWLEGGSLYEAVVTPITQQFDLIGLLITTYRVNDSLTQQLARVSSADIAYVVSTTSGLALVATTLRPEEGVEVIQQLRLQGGLSALLVLPTRLELRVGGEPWVGLLAPLRDGDDKVLGASLALTPVRQQAAGYRRLLQILVAVGLLAALLGILLSLAASRRLVRPIEQLAAAAEHASEGDYEQSIETSGTAEVKKLSGAFNHLLAELREKRDMEEFVSRLARNLPEASEVPVRRNPQRVEAVLLGVEFRWLVSLGAETGAFDRLSLALNSARGLVRSCGGEIETLAGHRLMATFQGQRAGMNALGAAAALVEKLSVLGNAFEEPTPPVVAIASGSLLRADAAPADRIEAMLAGAPVHQVDALLRESLPGDVAVASRLGESLRKDLEDRGLSLRPQSALLAGSDFFLLDEKSRKALRASVAATASSIGSSVGASAGGDAGATEFSNTLTGLRSVELAAGSVFGERYEILSVLGTGGMGVVYKAWDRELRDLVALKMLRSEAWVDDRRLEQLKEELKIARKVTHPNVLRTYDFGDVEGRPFISMEYVRGMTLRYLLEQTGRLPLSAGLRLMKRVCAGLEAAHGQGVLHGDIKPENIILEPNGTPKLMDFGIARRLAASARPDILMGTPHYLAPEQISKQDVDQRADIYACGVLAYEVFTGTLPFSDGTTMALLQRHLHDDPPPPRERWSEMPPVLEAVILRCLAKSPGDRFPSVGALAAALDSVSVAPAR